MLLYTSKKYKIYNIVYMQIEYIIQDRNVCEAYCNVHLNEINQAIICQGMFKNRKRFDAQILI